MTLLVTGGAGYIGSHTVFQLVEVGHQVVVLDSLYSGHRWALHPRAEFIEGHVGDRGLLQKVFARHRFDAVLHFAAHIEVGESVLAPAKYYSNNTASALVLLEMSREARVPKFIFSSTAAVYGEPTVSLVSETHPLQPVNPYGASKMMTERILADVGQASSGELQYVILRYFNVAGARSDLQLGQATPRATHLVKIASEAAIGVRESMSIHGTDYPTPDGTCLRDYLHVEDLAKAHLDALSYLNAGGQSDVFNVGYGRPYSVREVIEVMKRVTGQNFKVVEGPRRAGDSAALAAENTKILKALGWRPQFDNLELICSSAVQWEREYQKRLRNQ